MELNIEAMLHTVIAVGLISLIAVWGFYAWLKHAEKKRKESMLPD